METYSTSQDRIHTQLLKRVGCARCQESARLEAADIRRRALREEAGARPGVAARTEKRGDGRRCCVRGSRGQAQGLCTAVRGRRLEGESRGCARDLRRRSGAVRSKGGTTAARRGSMVAALDGGEVEDPWAACFTTAGSVLASGIRTRLTRCSEAAGGGLCCS